MKRIFSLSFTLFLFAVTFAQKDIIVTLGDHKYTKDEYEKIYTKNNTQLNDANEVKTPEEYLDLFINYKLKVIEGERQKLDTAKSFVDELAGYREELAKPYLTDIKITDSTLQNTYYRTTHMVRASHILINLPPNASAADTLKIYNQLMDIRQQFLDHKKSFEELALEYSNDPSAKVNKGDLGYFKAFSMLTEFENAAFNTKVGDVSLPFHTKYGFHIVYVTDKKPLGGEVQVSHIMKMFRNRNLITPQTDSLYKHELDSIYTLLKNGGDFAKLAKENSDDKNSARKGGDMGYIAKTFNVPVFADSAFSLQHDGDYTRPFRTDFGWHIVKRTDFRPVQSFDEVKDDLIKRIRKDPLRSEHSKELYYKKKKKEFNFQEYTDNIQKFKDYINSANASDTILNLDFPADIQALPLYKIEDTTYTVRDFFELQKKLKTNKSKFLKHLFFFHLDKYDEDVISDYMDTHLEKLYPEFADIMKEYHDGMVLFAIMEKEVWNKAVQDSIGLEKYYEQNKDKYIWDDNFKGLLIRCYNQAAADTCKKLLAEGITNADSLTNRINTGDRPNIRITEGQWEKGTNKRIDYLVFGGEMPEHFNPDLEMVHGEVNKAGTPKTLDESRGLYISDYQQVLEDRWVEQLRKNTKIKVNKKLLKEVKSVK